jgi:AbiTii
MKLLVDLIAELSASQPSLIDALVKTKVLLHRVGRKDLVAWVDHEINGYPDDAPLPSYRIVAAHVKGNVTNNAFSYSDHPLPTMHLNRQQRKGLQELEMRDSIAVLEGLAKNDKQGLQRPLPIEYAALFNKALSNGYRVQQAWCDIGIGRLGQITSQVRSKLLDFLLDLSEKVGANMSEEEIRRVAQSPETGSMFNNAIFGDNVTILVGNHSQQKVRIEIGRGDFNALGEFLKSNKVAEPDIDALKVALEADALTQEVEQKRLGPRVREWLSSMFGKAVEASWQVEVGIAGGLLTSALQKYYGW